MSTPAEVRGIDNQILTSLEKAGLDAEAKNFLVSKLVGYRIFEQMVDLVMEKTGRTFKSTRHVENYTRNSPYNFTDDVRAVLAAAREDAARRRHEYVGTEHILLGLLAQGMNDPANKIISYWIKNPELVRSQIELHLHEGKAAPNSSSDLPYTSRAKAIIEDAMKESRDLNDAHVGTEHLLLALISEGTGIPVSVLTEIGATKDHIVTAIKAGR